MKFNFRLLLLFVTLFFYSGCSSRPISEQKSGESLEQPDSSSVNYAPSGFSLTSSGNGDTYGGTNQLFTYFRVRQGYKCAMTDRGIGEVNQIPSYVSSIQTITGLCDFDTIKTPNCLGSGTKQFRSKNSSDGNSSSNDIPSSNDGLTDTLMTGDLCTTVEPTKIYDTENLDYSNNMEGLMAYQGHVYVGASVWTPTLIVPEVWCRAEPTNLEAMEILIFHTDTGELRSKIAFKDERSRLREVKPFSIDIVTEANSQTFSSAAFQLRIQTALGSRKDRTLGLYEATIDQRTFLGHLSCITVDWTQ